MIGHNPDILALDAHHETIPNFSDVCNFCKHYRHTRTCDAFPEGIPLSIWLEENDHRTPYPGDHGIQFEPIEASETESIKAVAVSR